MPVSDSEIGDAHRVADIGTALSFPSRGEPSCTEASSPVSLPQLHEQDLEQREGNWDDEYFGTWTTDMTFTTGGTQTVTLREKCPSTGTVENGTEEVYQAVQFEVSVGSVGGGFTALELTQPTTIWK